MDNIFLLLLQSSILHALELNSDGIHVSCDKDVARVTVDSVVLHPDLAPSLTPYVFCSNVVLKSSMEGPYGPRYRWKADVYYERSPRCTFHGTRTGGFTVHMNVRLGDDAVGSYVLSCFAERGNVQKLHPRPVRDVGTTMMTLSTLKIEEARK